MGRLWICLVVVFGLELGVSASDRPLIKDFVGINGHFRFKPELYQQVCGLVRNYQDMNWDVKKPGDPVTYPRCQNGVNWKRLYESWTQAGFEIDVCAQFGSFGVSNPNYRKLWEGQMDWVEDYGFQMASVLSSHSLATSIEIGNEPGSGFEDALYRNIFTRMATGIRRADPAMKIVTCTVHAAEAGKYHKDLGETFGGSEMQALYDVINLHVYANKAKSAQRHPWERSYPEDPEIDYLKRVDAVLDWRDTHAPDKEVWITEFGYDAATEAAMAQREGWFEKLGWDGVDDLQQAQYLVRSLLCFVKRDVARAYLYFYNDSDKASTHAASGLTRNFVPKPSFWAVKQFYEVLGNYRFGRVLRQKEGDLYAYEFVHGSDATKLIWVFWSPTGEGRKKVVTLHSLPSALKDAQSMAIREGGGLPVDYKSFGADGLQFEIGESPVYLLF